VTAVIQPSDISLTEFALMDNERVYLRCMMAMDIRGMYASLRNIAIILKKDDIKTKLDTLSRRAFFNMESLADAFYRIKYTGCNEVEFLNLYDPLSTETHDSSFVMRKIYDLINELQDLMGELISGFEPTPLSDRIFNLISNTSSNEVIPKPELNDLGVEGNG